ncbi:MAG: sugar ABC transporter permease [Propionivibrio sp.]|uniref:carbohydrate ABC transporter permease n=1 Tax=Propionivibrio sp. TaxID=2212460 RepID=UPI001B563E87|nr:sugar ABC transporter permease [Propionivibrio sp.]MBP7203491.1 sugar ABC transporter permease [Propionivibrio sp.]
MAAAQLAPVRRRLGTASYPAWFYIPAAVVFGVLFLAPMIMSFYFSLTRWTLFESTFIGFENFVQFYREPFLVKGLTNTLIYAVVTSGLKVIFGMLLGVLLTSDIRVRTFLRSVVFFPVLVSTVGIGITFTALMHPSNGAINVGLSFFGIEGPGWLTDPAYALLSVALVDVWKGVGLATIIFIAGIVAIPREYYEAAKIEGATAVQQFWKVTVPLARPATTTVIILSFIGGLRSFDLIWSMTRGGPGFTSDVIASVIYKQYQAGFYGLSTAGNVVLFLLVSVLVVPLSMYFNRKETRP